MPIPADDSVLPASFSAILLAEPDGTPSRLVDVSARDLGEGDVVIEVAYSSLNYKDGLALTGSAPIARHFPMIGGIDAAGRVISSADAGVAVGDEVIVTGWGLGEDHPGAYSKYLRVPSAWCHPLPESMSLRSAAIIGTAGLTAMLSFLALERNRSLPSDLGEFPLVVTGASGGVGSLSILLGARLGYRVIASTGRTSEKDYLAMLGANAVVDRHELSDMEPTAMGRVRYGAAVDTVGGTTLANLIRVARPEGTVAACGLAGGADLSLTVHPFILRGVNLVGVNSVRPRAEDREEAWARIASLVSDADMDAIATEVGLDDVIGIAPSILRGEVRGRIAVEVA